MLNKFNCNRSRAHSSYFCSLCEVWFWLGQRYGISSQDLWVIDFTVIEETTENKQCKLNICHSLQQPRKVYANSSRVLIRRENYPLRYFTLIKMQQIHHKLADIMERNNFFQWHRTGVYWSWIDEVLMKSLSGNKTWSIRRKWIYFSNKLKYVLVKPFYYYQWKCILYNWSS